MKQSKDKSYAYPNNLAVTTTQDNPLLEAHLLPIGLTPPTSLFICNYATPNFFQVYFCSKVTKLQRN